MNITELETQLRNAQQRLAAARAQLPKYIYRGTPENIRAYAQAEKEVARIEYDLNQARLEERYGFPQPVLRDAHWENKLPGHAYVGKYYVSSTGQQCPVFENGDGERFMIVRHRWAEDPPWYSVNYVPREWDVPGRFVSVHR